MSMIHTAISMKPAVHTSKSMNHIIRMKPRWASTFKPSNII